MTSICWYTHPSDRHPSREGGIDVESVGHNAAWPRWPWHPSAFPAPWRDDWTGGREVAEDSAYAWLPDQDGWDRFEWGSDWAGEVESLYTPHSDPAPARVGQGVRPDPPGSTAP